MGDLKSGFSTCVLVCFLFYWHYIFIGIRIFRFQMSFYSHPWNVWFSISVLARHAAYACFHLLYYFFMLSSTFCFHVLLAVSYSLTHQTQQCIQICTISENATMFLKVEVINTRFLRDCLQKLCCKILQNDAMKWCNDNLQNEIKKL